MKLYIPHIEEDIKYKSKKFDCKFQYNYIILLNLIFYYRSTSISNFQYNSIVVPRPTEKSNYVIMHDSKYVIMYLRYTDDTDDSNQINLFCFKQTKI